MAGFLLLLGPTCEGVTMPVIPARLMLDLVERGEPASQIAPAQASRLGHGIGTWLVDDVIGLDSRLGGNNHRASRGRPGS
jgi:hypothetical protein